MHKLITIKNGAKEAQMTAVSGSTVKKDEFPLNVDVSDLEG